MRKVWTSTGSKLSHACDRAWRLAISRGRRGSHHLRGVLTFIVRKRTPWLLKMIENDPQFDSLQGRADFQAFMKRLEADAAAKS